MVRWRKVEGSDEPGLLFTPPAAPSAEDDGFLTATEIAALKLDADWVILSACNTAAGGAQEAEALSGLAAGVSLRSGARAPRLALGGKLRGDGQARDGRYRAARRRSGDGPRGSHASIDAGADRQGDGARGPSVKLGAVRCGGRGRRRKVAGIGRRRGEGALPIAHSRVRTRRGRARRRRAFPVCERRRLQNQSPRPRTERANASNHGGDRPCAFRFLSRSRSISGRPPKARVDTYETNSIILVSQSPGRTGKCLFAACKTLAPAKALVYKEGAPAGDRFAPARKTGFQG